MPARFEPEIVYPFWREAGGVVQEAMRLAAKAGEKRVPKKPHVWAEYATKHGWAERMAKEEKDRWDAYHKAREERQQQTLDAVAETFEGFMGSFAEEVLQNVKDAQSDNEGLRNGGLRALQQRFGNMKAVNQFFRMYLRARGEPETISSTKIEHSGEVRTYSDLEPAKKAKTVEEARRMAAEAEED